MVEARSERGGYGWMDELWCGLPRWAVLSSVQHHYHQLIAVCWSGVGVSELLWSACLTADTLHCVLCIVCRPQQLRLLLSQCATVRQSVTAASLTVAVQQHTPAEAYVGSATAASTTPTSVRHDVVHCAAQHCRQSDDAGV